MRAHHPLKSLPTITRNTQALSMIERNRALSAVVSFYGPLGFRTMDEDMALLGRIAAMGPTNSIDSAESKLPGYAIGENSEAARFLEPVGRLSQMNLTNLPLLFVRHRDTDPIIAHGQSERLAAAWKMTSPQTSIDFELVAGAGHGGATFDTDSTMSPMREFEMSIFSLEQ